MPAGWPQTYYVADNILVFLSLLPLSPWVLDSWHVHNQAYMLLRMESRALHTLGDILTEQMDKRRWVLSDSVG